MLKATETQKYSILELVLIIAPALCKHIKKEPSREYVKNTGITLVCPDLHKALVSKAHKFQFLNTNKFGDSEPMVASTK